MKENEIIMVKLNNQAVLLLTRYPLDPRPFRALACPFQSQSGLRTIPPPCHESLSERHAIVNLPAMTAIVVPARGTVR
jgi:hypothetical protein